MSTTTQTYQRSPELIKRQKWMLYALKKFHEICVENNIKYSLHGGTLLGAVREKGFIPWDDDADVTLTRDNYNKLIQVIPNYEEDNFIFVDGIERLPRIVMKTEDGVVWIDLFIYDYISESKLLQKIKIYTIVALDAFLKSKETIALTKERGKYKSWKFAIFYLIYRIGCIFPLRKRINLMHRFSANYLCGERKSIFRSNDQYAGKLLIHPSGVMQAYTFVDFEDARLMITEKYDEILTMCYGKDYMIPHMYVGPVEANVHDQAREMLIDAFTKASQLKRGE